MCCRDDVNFWPLFRAWRPWTVDTGGPLERKDTGTAASFQSIHLPARSYPELRSRDLTLRWREGRRGGTQADVRQGVPLSGIYTCPSGDLSSVGVGSRSWGRPSGAGGGVGSPPSGARSAITDLAAGPLALVDSIFRRRLLPDAPAVAGARARRTHGGRRVIPMRGRGWRLGMLQP